MSRLLLFLPTLLLLGGCANTGKAAREAASWIESAPAYQNVTIERFDPDHVDSDDNGRVSVDVHVKHPDGRFEVVTLECLSSWGPQPFKNGCRKRG